MAFRILPRGSGECYELLRPGTREGVRETLREQDGAVQGKGAGRGRMELASVRLAGPDAERPW